MPDTSKLSRGDRLLWPRNQYEMVSSSAVADIPERGVTTRLTAGKWTFQLRRGIKNASHLALGNIVTQAIGLIGFTYIARVLGPNDYGIYITVGAFVGMFDVLLLNGVNKVVIREGSRDISAMHQTLEKTIALRHLLSVLAITVCIACSFLTPYAFQTRLYIMLFSLQLAHTGLAGFLATIYQATEQMQYIAILSIIKSALYVAVSVLLLSCGFGLPALFLTVLGADLVMILATYKHSRRLIRFSFVARLQFDWRLLKPALVFSLLGFMAFLLTKIDLLMISFLGNAESVGVYGVAYKICQQGERLRNVCAVAFFPIFVKHLHRETIKSAVLTRYSLFFLGGILALTAIASLLAEDVVTAMFGARYAASGNILSILIFYLGFSWASLPFTIALQATHNEKHLIAPSLLMGGLNVVLNYVFFSAYGLVGIAYATLVVMAGSCLMYGTITLWVMRKQGYLV